MEKLLTGTGDYNESITHTVGYPSRKTEDGKSTDTMTRTDVFNDYNYLPSKYLDKNTVIYDVLFGREDDKDFTDFGYWLASRSCSGGGDDTLYFAVGRVRYWPNTYPDLRVSGNMIGYDPDSEGSFSYSGIQAGVRPIVYLKETLKTSGQNNDRAWTIIDEK